MRPTGRNQAEWEELFVFARRPSRGVIRRDSNAISIGKGDDVTDAVMISANPNRVDIDDASRHLEYNKELYWSVDFPIDKHKFTFPISRSSLSCTFPGDR